MWLAQVTQQLYSLSILGQYNLVLLTGLMWIDHCKEIWKLMFQAFALCQSDYGRIVGCVVYIQKDGAVLLVGA